MRVAGELSGGRRVSNEDVRPGMGPGGGWEDGKEDAGRARGELRVSEPRGRTGSPHRDVTDSDKNSGPLCLPRISE